MGGEYGGDNDIDGRTQVGLKNIIRYSGTGKIISYDGGMSTLVILTRHVVNLLPSDRFLVINSSNYHCSDLKKL